MSVIHIARDRKALGQFSQEEVAEGLKSGRFFPTDLGWQEPMEAWKPLSEFDFSLVEPAPSLQLEEAPVPPPALPEPAWERREEIGYFKAGLGTIRQIVFTPAGTFRNLARTGGLLGPLMFCYSANVVCYLIGFLFAIGWLFLLPKQAMEFYQAKSASGFLQQQVFLMPILLMFYLVLPFLMSGAYHLALMLVAKTHGNYEITYRVNCYVSGGLALLGALPVPPFSSAYVVYALVFVAILVTYMTIALREAHGTTTAVALICTIVPPLFLSCCCIFAAGLGSTVPMMGGKGVTLP